MVSGCNCGYLATNERKFRTPDALAVFLRGQNPHLNPLNTNNRERFSRDGKLLSSEPIYMPVFVMELARDMYYGPFNFADSSRISRDADTLQKFFSYIKGQGDGINASMRYKAFRALNPRIHLPDTSEFTTTDLVNLVVQTYGFIDECVALGGLRIPCMDEVLSGVGERLEFAEYRQMPRNVTGEDEVEF